MSVPEPNDSKPNPPNPYQPPQTATEWAPAPVPRDQPRRPPHVWAIVFSLIGGLSYLSFIVVLFRSSGSDRLAGQVFLCNLLLWLAVVIWETLRYHVVWRSYSVLVIVQCIILGGMLETGFGDPEAVITINLIVIAIAACLGGMSLASTWRHKVR